MVESLSTKEEDKKCKRKKANEEVIPIQPRESLFTHSRNARVKRESKAVIPRF
jgi:hypothetical protein